MTADEKIEWHRDHMHEAIFGGAWEKMGNINTNPTLDAYQMNGRIA